MIGREEDMMGMHTRNIGLIVAALCLAVAMLAWVTPAAADEDAECAEMEELGVCAHSPGIAYYYDDRRPEVWVTLGSNDGLRVTARVKFVRDEEVVAEGTVTTVREVDCIVYPDREVPGGAIMLGDSMYVVENGSRQAADAAIARERRGHAFLTLLVSGGLAYLIAL